MVGKLVLDAEKFSSAQGKIGAIQIEIPAYQLSGNFDLNFTPNGVVSTKLDGRALAQRGDTCSNGAPVYAYIREIDEVSTVTVSDIAATPANISLAVAGTRTLTVLGLQGGLYKPVTIANADCTFVSDTPAKATVSSAGVITGVAAGTAYVTVTYSGLTDIVKVTVTA